MHYKILTGLERMFLLTKIQNVGVAIIQVYFRPSASISLTLVLSMKLLNLSNRLCSSPLNGTPLAISQSHSLLSSNFRKPQAFDNCSWKDATYVTLL